ncbi:M16 family metallopeptidase [Chthonobacter albigriseus]|uniref:M16 family metallopeptidase n=1 Tax=Chthonobacter albigriseus TaxID=1683161 RepID=UPI0015EE83C1|nr:pitrilysin family protein [Chthonobacter albigriseus]
MRSPWWRPAGLLSVSPAVIFLWNALLQPGTPVGIETHVLADPYEENVEVRLYVGVGASDDGDDRQLAHFVEHLVFLKDRPPEAFRPLALPGVSNNAFTTATQTFFIFRGGSDDLPEMVDAAAAVLDPLDVDPDQARRERKVVARELDWRYRTDPFGGLNQQITAALYAGHPFGRAAELDRIDLDGLTLEEAAAFHQAWYTVPNAHLVITGAVDPTEARRLAAAAFASRPSAPPPERPALGSLPLPGGAERISVVVEGIERPRLRIAAIAPVSGDAASLQADAEVLNRVLGGNLPGALATVLRDDNGMTLASGVDIRFFVPMPGWVHLDIDVTLAVGADAADVEFKTRSWLGGHRAAMIDETAFYRMRARAVREAEQMASDVSARGADLGTAMAMLPPDTALGWGRSLGEAGPLTARRILRAIADPHRIVTGWMMPGSTPTTVGAVQ